MKLFLLTIGIFCPLFAVAAESQFGLGFDQSFAAPTVYSSSGVTNTEVGQIIYDLQAGQFKGFDKSGTFIPLSNVSGSNAVISAGSVKLEWARVTAGTTPVIVASSSWLALAARNNAGDYSWTMSGFSQSPACNVTIPATNAYFVGATVSSATALRTTSYNSGQANQDADIMIVCVGTPN